MGVDRHPQPHQKLHLRHQHRGLAGHHQLRGGAVSKLTTAYHPQTNYTERVNRTLKAILASYVGEQHNQWDRLLPSVLL